MRPPIPVPPMVPLFINIYDSSAADPFPPDSSLPRTTSPASPGCASFPPVRLSISPNNYS